MFDVNYVWNRHSGSGEVLMRKGIDGHLNKQTDN